MTKPTNRDELQTRENKIRLITYFVGIFAHIADRMDSLGENKNTLHEMRETISMVMTRLQVTLFPELKTVGELMSLLDEIDGDVDSFKDSMIYRRMQETAQNINTDIPN